MKRNFILLLTLLQTWCDASIGPITPENDCSEQGVSGSGINSGSGEDETVNLSCPTATYTTFFPVISQPLSTTVPSPAKSLILASLTTTSSLTSHETPSPTGFHVPSSEPHQTSKLTSLFAPGTSHVVASVSGVTFTQASVFSLSHPRFSPKAITPTAVIYIQPTVNSSIYTTLPPRTSVEATNNMFTVVEGIQTDTLSNSSFSFLSRSSTMKPQPSTSLVYMTSPVKSTPTATFSSVYPKIKPKITPSNLQPSTSSIMKSFKPFPTPQPYVVLSPPVSMHLSNIEMTETLQLPHMTTHPPLLPHMTTHPPLLPSSHMVTPPHPTLMESPIPQSKTISTALMATASSTSTGSGPTVSLEIGTSDMDSVDSSPTASPYIAVVCSVGGCTIIAGVVIGLIAVGAVLYKRRRHVHWGTAYTTGGTLRRSSMVGDMSAGLYLSLSETDGCPTAQLSRSSPLLAPSMTPTPPKDSEKRMFDHTLDTAYKSSTFQRSKHVAMSGLGSSSNQDTHGETSFSTERETENHTPQSPLAAVDSHLSDDNSKSQNMSIKRDSYVISESKEQSESNEQLPSPELVENTKEESTENSQRDGDSEDQLPRGLDTSAEMKQEVEEKEIASEKIENEYLASGEKGKNQTKTQQEKEVVEKGEIHVSSTVEAVKNLQCDAPQKEPASQTKSGEPEEGQEEASTAKTKPEECHKELKCNTN